MNGQRDEKDILSTPKRKKHHIDYTHINKNEQKELGERRITSCWTQAAFGGRQNGFVYPQRRHSVRSHMSNVVVSIVQVCTGSTWWKRTQSIPPIARISSLLSIPILLSIKTKLKHHIDYTHIKKLWTKKLREERNHLVLNLGCDWGVKKDLFTPQRQLLLLFYTVCMVNVMKKDSIYSHNATLCSILSYPRLLSFKT